MSSLLTSLSARAAMRRTRTETLLRQLQDSHLVAGFWCHGLTVRQLQGLRGGLPSTARLVVAKNTFIEKAVSGTPWENLVPCAKGMVAWLFVHTDEIRPALAACRDFQRNWKLGLHDFVGGVFEGQLYGPDEFNVLENMPTRQESNAFLLGCLQTPAFSLIGTLQVSEWNPEKKADGEAGNAAAAAAQ